MYAYTLRLKLQKYRFLHPASRTNGEFVYGGQLG